jgi:hypothetical protein
MLGEVCLVIYEKLLLGKEPPNTKEKFGQVYLGFLICCKLIIDDFWGEFCSLDLL